MVSKMLNFQAFIPLRNTFVANFIESRALISRKYEAKQGVNITSLSKTFALLWMHSAVFALEKKPSKMLNFQVFQPLKKHRNSFSENM